MLGDAVTLTTTRSSFVSLDITVGWGLDHISLFRCLHSFWDDVVQSGAEYQKSSRLDVRDASLHHLSSPEPSPLPSKAGEISAALDPETSDGNDDRASTAEQKILEQKKDVILLLLQNYEANKHMLRRPRLYYLTGESWVNNLVRILESDDWAYDVGIQKWVNDTFSVIELKWTGGQIPRDDTEALQFFLELSAEDRRKFHACECQLSRASRNAVPETLFATVSKC